MLNEREIPDPEQPLGGTTFTPKQVRILKIAIGIMSILLVVGFILLLVGIFRQTSRSQNTDPRVTVQRQIDAPMPLMHLPLKPGMQISSVLADQGRLIVHLHGANGDELVVIDLASGWQQQRIIVSPQQ